MKSSSKNSAVSTKKRVKVKEKEDSEKKLNMYIIIWPEDKLVLNRTMRVKGRMIWLKISTRGKKSIRPDGAPNGSICARKSKAWVLKITTIKDNHKATEAEHVK